LTPEGRFPKEAEEFVDACLLKDPEERKTPKVLLVSGSLLCEHCQGQDSNTLSFLDICVDGYG
jgi:hypothetical protein